MEDSARDLFFDLLLLFFPLNIVSKIYQSAYHDGQLTQQAAPPVHSVTTMYILESTTVTVDNSLDEMFDQTWVPTDNVSRQKQDYLICADLSHHSWIIVYRTCRIYFSVKIGFQSTEHIILFKLLTKFAGHTTGRVFLFLFSFFLK